MIENLKNFVIGYGIMTTVLGAVIYFVTLPLLFLSPGVVTSLLIGGTLSSLWYGRKGFSDLLSFRSLGISSFRGKNIQYFLFSAVSFLILFVIWYSL
jgi:hypothetical protein